MNHAKAFAMVRESMMKSAANADGDAVGQSLPRREDGSSGRQPECLHQRGRKGNFQFHLLARAERAGFQLVDVLGFVDQQNVLIGRGLWLQNVAGFSDACLKQSITNAAILFGREDMSTDGKVIAVAVDELEGEHGSAFPSYCVPHEACLASCHAERMTIKRTSASSPAAHSAPPSASSPAQSRPSPDRPRHWRG